MVTFDRVDLEFVLQQILMAEAGQPPVNPHLAFGLREVAGTNNNSVPGNETFGSADQVFPRVTTPVFRTVTVNIDGTIFDPNPGVAGDTMTTTYADTSATGLVVDTAPRTISNLIADQTANNPAALEAQAGATPGDGYLYQGTTLIPNPAFNPDLPEDLTNLRFLPSNVAFPEVVDASGNLFIPNVTPDAGLSAPFNQWFTFFGQFFDHGLDLVTKGGSGTIFIPLQPDDPLITVGPDGIAGTGDEITDPSLQFMVLTRATNLPGPDGIVGTADDIHENTNTTTPFVDQNQTYSSHPSHQVFLRDYMIGADGHLHSTGKLLTGADGHSMATWADVKANALKLGILLSDEDVNNVPLLATDAFGNFIPDPVTGMAQIVMKGADGLAGTADDVLVSGTPDNPIATTGAVRTGHAFLNDIAHGAAPSDPDAPGPHLVADADTVAGGPPPAAGFYDNELLDAHYIAGDGRANENIALTAIHDIFHAEHNRQIEAVKAQIQAELDKGDTSFAGNWVLAGVDLTVANGVDAAGNPVHIIQADEWNGERLFQVAKFSTETQYQHLVFEEFARKVSPNIHLFGNNDIHLDPAITSEFANVVYRFGHSMLDENVNRYVIGPDGTPLLDANGQPVLNQIGLIDAFLNPLAFAAAGATATGEIVLGSVNQVANEIDEFVTGALRNNLLGLPLDLAAINIARGRDTGVAPLNLLRNQIYTELNTGGTNDTTMKPYASWDEFGQFLKHAGSLVNFVAAYGTHASIIGATTLLDKRAAALALVENAVLGGASFSQDAYDFMHSLGAYANDINNPLAVHAEWSTGSVTGLDTVDLWIGGLAEKQNLFGGLLGSTFNFIFENQMEAIQDGDRLYYLPRIEGLHFGTEIENNTFADLIMRNTGTHHLSANIFMTPEYVVEAGTVDPNDPSTWLRNSVTGALLVEVLTDDYVDALFGDGQHHVFDTQVHFLGDDNFFGNTMVLGGTEGRDVLIAGQADDDTVYGDGGDDFLDGGNGNDVLFGGAGNDIIRDSAGDDIIHGGSGNDDIDGGLGLDVIFGEDGDDLLHGGNSTDFGDEISGGTGNDIIFGDEGDDELIGNEGDDWIEGGDGGDALIGDIGAPTGQVPLYSGNDVLDGGTQGDKMVGFSGDDIMLGLGGFDKFTGLLGFDWGSFENETHGVSVDMTKREFIPDQLAPAGDAVRDFWIETEAVSGSAFDDVLGGTNVGQALPGAAPFVDTFNELVNVNLITGLADFFPEGPVAFSDGNIMLGGGGNDFIEGRGGNDIIDGDAYLHVELTRDANGNIFPGSQIVREILFDTTPGNIDTAVFTGNLADYTINFTPDAQGFITVTDNVGTDGTDRLRNIERLQFADVTIGTTNSVPTGTVVVNGTAQVGQVLTADAAAIADADGIVSPFSFQWQYQILAAPGGTSQWVDIVGATDATFAPTDFYVGNALRVVTSFVDGQGFTERLFSVPTALLVTDPAVNHAPTVVTQVAENGLFDTSARQDTPFTLFLPLVTTFTDDQTNAANLIYTATLADGSDLSTVGLIFTTTPDGAGGVTGGLITGTPPAGFIGIIDIRVKATDAGGLSVTDTFTINVLPSDGISTGAAALPAPLVADPEHIGVQFDRTDLEHVLRQILQAEAGQPPVNPHLAFGLREVAGTNNNSVPGNETFGSADQVFPRVTTPVFRTVTVNIDGTIFDPNPGVAGDTMTTTYADTSATGLVVDTAPRTISNLIVDQTANNPAALEAQAGATPGDGYLYQGTTLIPNPAFNPDLPEDLTNLRFLPSNVAFPEVVDASGNLFIPNVTPDAGLSAPFNQWFTFFGQFFDHGLDLVTKGGSGTIFIPLQPDDPLITVGPDGIAGTGDEITDPSLQFMVLTRATNLPGPDGIVGTADDIHENTNTTTPFVDQNQTYSSHPSHQVFLRDYMIGADGHLHSTGRLLTGTDGHSMATWADVKANALKLGILLSDEDANNVPLLATDAFGNFIPDPVTGMAQIVMKGADGLAGTADDVLVSGTPDNPIATTGAVRTGHAFLNDIAHGAAPSDPDAPGPHLVADADTVAGGPPPAAGFYDNELLDAHYIAGDGRANENIALTAIHDIFHAEHNRQIEAVKAQIQAELDKGDTSFAGNWVLAGVDLTVANGVDAAGNPVHIIQADEWNGERLFQVAKFSTETQYQHLVFEEFARKVSPNIHLFGNNDIHLDPAITSEFANVVYRFGHSMLDENVNRYVIGPDGTPLLDANGQPVLNQIGLIDAFLNPLAFAAAGATATGEIVLGSVNQVANEIDEFVTGALRNNLLGLPLDLAAINIARGRDTGVAPLNLLRNQIYTELNTGGTNDTTMKPYASWDEFGQFLKHAGSLVNFVAAYGTHASIIGATTLLDKRAAALALVENAVLGGASFSQDAYDFMHSLGAYANDINNPLAVHAEWSTGSVTGLDTVDLWIGGLAEKQNLFGGLLGSTFNFIFENQMEAIQDADRLYYLPRIEGLHFGTEIENNTFADLIMRNTGTHHLSANIFMTPEYVVEAGTVDPNDPSTWLRNSVTGALLVEVLTDDYVDALFGDGQHHVFDTQVHFLGDDNFFGNTMVLGGTEGRDVLIAGQADDDTVYGDGGDDFLDGGNGNDVLFGGAGNDIIRDSAGDDIIHGGSGNDDIDGGLGLDVIFGEDGDDLLHGGNSTDFGDEISGGTGNDIIFGDEGDDELIGNEGDDWIEGGDGGDALVGDIGAPTGQVPLYSGNDVLDGGTQGDKMVGFSGDDIMLGLGGFDKFTGLLGFDWGSFENETHGVSVDMTKREFIPAQTAPAGDAVRDFWIETEAVSGSAFDDVLGGTNVGQALPGAAPFVDTFNELVNVNLITGLADFFPEGPVAFSDGNIMLGGGGNDFIEGRGGNDIIDGDAYLHVELTRDANGNIFPGSQIVREILFDTTPGNIDTAVFTGNLADYTINFTPDAQGFITVTDNVGTDGTDRLRNIERLQFADVTIGTTNSVPTGTVVVNGTAQVGQVLTADAAAIADADGIVSPFSFQWQYQILAAPGGTSQWVDIVGATDATFAPTDFYVGNALRVVTSFVDGQGFTERLFSVPTALLVTDPAVNHAPTVVTQVAENGLFDTSARQDTPFTLFLPLVTTFTDDQTNAANLIYTATLADGSDLSTVGLIFTTTPDGAGGVTGGLITGTPPAGFIGIIDIRVKATDAGGLSVTDTFTINVLPSDGISTGAAALPAPLVADPEHIGVQFDRTDLEHVLRQILQAEAGQPPVNPHLAFGLREVAGTNNNSVPGNETFGSADQVFPRVTTPVFRTVTVNIDGTIFDPNPGVAGDTMTTTYADTSATGLVVDTAPRTISNLIADQTANNPAALEAQAGATPGDGYLYQGTTLIPNPAFNPDLPEDLTNLRFLPSNVAFPEVVDASGNLFIPNVTPDAGLSAPFNQWFTFFGQFFDHGLDLVTKGGSGTIFIPLQPDDPLITVGPDGIAGTGDEITDPSLQFMVLTRATNLPGPDGIVGTADDIHENTNTTTPFVDQNQTYSSHPSHQVFLRDYMIGADGHLHSTGKLLTGADGHSMATWADVKANALKLGILLSDEDVNNVPLLATDAFGNFIPDPVTGMAQIVMKGADGLAGTADDVLVSGTPDNPIATTGAVRTGHAFLNDIAHGAAPSDPDAPGPHLVADADTVAGGPPPAAGFYDNELLDAHYIAGDGRANENIALTAIHDIFHAEHNRQIEAVKAQIQAELDKGDTSFAGNWVLAGVDLTIANGVDAAGNPVHIIQADEWNGERLFQVAKFSTETQYQHLVFEEFARKVSPNIHLFGNNDIHLDPAITAEFAHAVYRFGHSMLDENVNRYVIGPDGTPLLDPVTGQPVLNQIGLIDAFLNPLAFAAQGATATGEIVLGAVNQVANEIDEFVTGALRNNLLGLPLDLAAINIARGRDTGVAPLNLLRNQIYTELNTGGTNDTTMKPYASWDEFGQFLKHAGSLVNFVAAYGTHASIIGATTLLDKRAAALALVENAVLGGASFSQDAYDFMHSLGAYANDINNPLAVHAEWSTGSVTGLDTVDLWIGGLAEKQNLFGGLLGSTFNFIFENQMEAIQDGDRLYYLPRIEGLHFGTEIENNTFADLIMRNTGTHHLSANIFMTPEYVVEAGTVDPNDPSTWLRNSVTGALLVEVLTDDYVDALFGDGQHHVFDTQVHFLGDDNFFGNTMVLGGTEGRDVLIAGQADDDTVYGDGGDDFLDGGNGNDVLFGGAGNDIIRDSAGDDIIHGGSGNDDIDGGLGLDVIFGEDGDDLLHGGNSTDFGDEISGGTGNDIIFGDEGDDELIGNEGDDWIEGGDGGDALIGDIGAPTGQVPLYSGNDVLDGGTQGDKMVGFSGDDIMLGLGGFDKFTGLLGFDWGSFENETHGVSVDMTRREFIPAQTAPAGDAVRDFWIETEAVSGSAFDDVLGGTNVGQAQPGAAPFVDTFNELVNVNLITGLDRYFPGASTGTPVAFSDGNIMLGGGGSDFIEGRGGNDIIDGDARLHVELTRDANGHIFAGSQIVRQILTDQAVGPTFGLTTDPFTGEEVLGVLTAGDIDTAVYADVSANYQIGLATDADGNILLGSDGNPVLTVTHVTPTPGAVIEGTDILHNIERLQFADVTIDNPFAAVADFAAQGTLTIDNAAPAVGDILSVTSTINDFEGVLVNGVLDAATAGFLRIDIPLNELNLQWQYEVVSPGGLGLQWVDIAGATGTTFTPTDFHLGGSLRVVASFTDGLGVTERVFSTPTALLVTDPAVNHAPTVVTQVAENGLFDTSAREGQPITLFLPLVTTFTDDTTNAANLIYTATLADGTALETIGLSFTTTPDGAGGVTGGVITGTPPADFTGTIDIRVKATDAGGLSVTDTFTINVVPNTNHAPIITSDGGEATAGVSVAENSTLVTDVTAADPDSGAVLAFSIAGGADAALFTIDPITGVLSFVTQPNFEAPADADANNVYDVIVQVSDGTLADTQAIAVTVTNVNESPVITSNGGGATAVASVAENTTAVTTVTAADPDAGAIVTFSIAGGADASKFAIDSTTGALAFVIAPDFEVPTDAGGDNVYDVVVQVSDGSLIDTQAIAVTVTDANESPVITSDGGGDTALASVAENNTAVTTVTAVDPDAGALLTFSIAGGADGALFTIDAGTGALSFIEAPDFEVPTDAGSDNVYDVIVQVSDGSLDDTQAIAVTVANVGGVTITGTGGNNIVNAATTVPGQPLPTNEEDTILGLGGADILSGLGGNDVIDGGAGVDSIFGGAGNDTIIGGTGGDALSGEAGNDTFTYTIGDGADAVDGGAGSDTLNILGNGAGNTLNVVLNGSVITNFEGGAVTGVESITADLLGGADRLSYAGTTGGVTVDLAAGTASGFTSIAGIENVTGGSGADTLSGAGNALVNNLTGGTGDDTYFADLGDTITELAGGGIDSVFTTSATFTLAANVENLTFTGLGNFTGTGNAANNVITGGSGTDVLSGGGGTDTLIGGAGVDSLNGGDGNDLLIGGAANDVMNGGAGNDTFVFAVGFGNDTISGFDANPANGQDLLDISGLGITAADFAANVLITDLGNDTQIAIGNDSILLLGVNGVVPNSITIDDFRF